MVAGLWAGGIEGIVDLPWIPSIGSRFTLALDPLAAPLAVFVAGLAVPVLIFTAAYLPHHLEEEGMRQRAILSFSALMLGFMGAVLLLILAQDLLLIFLALELTALASFLLIRFDSGKQEARSAALLALVVTAGSSLLFLLGVLLIAAEEGATTLQALRDAPGDVPGVAVFLIVAGVIAKSAQAPLHFWLPRAMIAPTPVSAYLHSATLVAAGVFVLQRLRFLLETVPGLLDGLFWFAFLSIAVGGLIAFTSDAFKRVLAYSTTAQYGYGVALIGAGGELGAVAAPYFLVAHGLAKCALFMTAGAVTTATGEERLSESGGLARGMPLLAAGSGIAAAALAGLPLTMGYFKDEFLLKAALERGPLAVALAAAGIALTLAYTARFWFGIFGGPRRAAPAADRRVAVPILALGAVAIAGGLWIAPFKAAFEAAGSWIAQTPATVHFAYKLSPGPVLWLTLAAWAAGALLALASGRTDRRFAPPLARLSASFGAAAFSDRLARGSAALSDLLHGLEVRDLRDRLAAILAPTAAFVLFGLWAQGSWPSFGPLDRADLPLLAAFLLCGAAALAAAQPRPHLSFVLLLSFVGFSLALIFALAFAPDVALVLVLIETAFTLLFLALLSRLRPRVLRRARRRLERNRGPVAGILAGVVGTAAAWVALSAPRDDTVALEQIALTEAAHAKDVVTAILADFRGLDTAGELTVVVVAIIGAAATAWGTRE